MTVYILDRKLCQLYQCGDPVISGNSANVTFTSDDPDATFRCRLNGRRIRQCMHISYLVI